MNGTSIFEYSSIKVSGTNFMFKYWPNFLGGKLEILKTNRRVACAMYIALCTRTRISMLCDFRVELGTFVECEPTSIVPTFQTSIHEGRAV